MARFHVNPATGNTGPCKASKVSCPHGGESGEENHYGSEAEAQSAAETLMASKYKEVYNGYRKGETAGLDLSQAAKKHLITVAASGSPLMTPAVIGRVLSQDSDELVRKHVAENLKSQKLLRDMSDDDSSRVRKAVAVNTNNRDVLAKLATDPNGAVRLAVISNPKTPVKARKAAVAFGKALKASKLNLNVKPRGDDVGSSQSAPAAPKASADVNAEAKANMKVASILSDPHSFFLHKKAVRDAVAEAHSVPAKNVFVDPYTSTVNVTKDSGVIVYSSWGYRRGVGSKAVADEMLPIRKQLESEQNQAVMKGGKPLDFAPHGKTAAAFLKAHNASGSARIIEQEYGVDDRRFSVRAGDGKIYTYSSRNLEVLSIK